MTAIPRAVSRKTLGAWVLKASPEVSAVEALAASGFETVESWCVRATYRAELVEAGQPVLLWISGRSTTRPAGIYAQGRAIGAAVADAPDEGPTGRHRVQLRMPVELEPLAAPVLRADLLAHPVLSRVEVLTMAAGSNPSYLDRQALAALRSSWPQVTVGP